MPNFYHFLKRNVEVGAGWGVLGIGFQKLTAAEGRTERLTGRADAGWSFFLGCHPAVYRG
jgi:hypothetical protein